MAARLGLPNDRPIGAFDDGNGHRTLLGGRANNPQREVEEAVEAGDRVPDMPVQAVLLGGWSRHDRVCAADR